MIFPKFAEQFLQLATIENIIKMNETIKALDIIRFWDELDHVGIHSRLPLKFPVTYEKTVDEAELFEFFAVMDSDKFGRISVFNLSEYEISYLTPRVKHFTNID